MCIRDRFKEPVELPDTQRVADVCRKHFGNVECREGDDKSVFGGSPMQKTLKKARWFTVFVVPTLLAFLASFLAPFLMGIYLSFCKFTTVTRCV